MVGEELIFRKDKSTGWDQLSKVALVVLSPSCTEPLTIVCRAEALCRCVKQGAPENNQSLLSGRYVHS